MFWTGAVTVKVPGNAAVTPVISYPHSDCAASVALLATIPSAAPVLAFTVGAVPPWLTAPAQYVPARSAWLIVRDTVPADVESPDPNSATRDPG